MELQTARYHISTKNVFTHRGVVHYSEKNMKIPKIGRSLVDVSTSSHDCLLLVGNLALIYYFGIGMVYLNNPGALGIRGS